jgi:hypothetical protein
MLAFNAWNLLLSASFVILGALQAYSIPLTTVVAEGSEPRSMQNFTLRELAAEDENGNSAPHRLVKRFDDARFSFYDAGLGACGEVNTNSDFVSVILFDACARCCFRFADENVACSSDRCSKYCCK